MSESTTPIQITVRGRAIRRAAAERARVTVTSRWQAESPEQAMGTVREAHQRTADAARAFAERGAAESWQADRAWIGHQREWVGDGQPQRLVYVASASVKAEFVDFEALGTWIAELGAAPVYEVGDITWTLSEDTERKLAREARGEAIADALARAEDYARAAKLGAVRVAAIREPGTASEPSPMAAKAEMMAFRSASDTSGVAIQEGDISVGAAVEVTFESRQAG